MPHHIYLVTLGFLSILETSAWQHYIFVGVVCRQYAEVKQAPGSSKATDTLVWKVNTLSIFRQQCIGGPPYLSGLKIFSSRVSNVHLIGTILRILEPGGPTFSTTNCRIKYQLPRTGRDGNLGFSRSPPFLTKFSPPDLGLGLCTRSHQRKLVGPLQGVWVSRWQTNWTLLLPSWVLLPVISDLLLRIGGRVEMWYNVDGDEMIHFVKISFIRDSDSVSFRAIWYEHLPFSNTGLQWQEKRDSPPNVFSH